jgi:hypothetical protein
LIAYNNYQKKKDQDRFIKNKIINMAYLKIFIVFCFSQVIILNAVAQTINDYPEDKKTIEEGKALFTQNCSSCHSFTQRGIGPDLSGVTTELTKPMHCFALFAIHRVLLKVETHAGLNYCRSIKFQCLHSKP